jgi:hypothetical protein
MKTILPWLCLLLLVSCSHPPPPEFQPFGPDANHPAATAPAAKPAAQSAPQHAAVKPPAAPAMTNEPTSALAPAITNAAARTNVPAPSGAAAVGNPARPVPPLSVPTLDAALGRTNQGPFATQTQSEDEMLPAGTIRFPATDLNQVLKVYAELVNRTILRPANLGAPLITLETQTPLTKKEAIAAFDAVLAMNGITMINVGDKFVKAVPAAAAATAGEAPDKRPASELPDLGPYVTYVKQLRYTKPSELVPALTPFAQIPNSILPIDSSQILVLRDYTENVKRMLEMVERIDIAIPPELVNEVIPIKYAKAADIANALNSLSSGGGGTSIGGSTGTTGRPGGGAGGAGRPGFGVGPASARAVWVASAAWVRHTASRRLPVAPPASRRLRGAAAVSATDCATSSRAPRLPENCRFSVRPRSLPMNGAIPC